MEAVESINRLPESFTVLLCVFLLQQENEELQKKLEEEKQQTAAKRTEIDHHIQEVSHCCCR